MLLDNKGQNKVGNALADALRPGVRLTILSAFFSIHAYAALKGRLGRIDSLRLLIPSNNPVSDPPGGPRPFHVPGLCGDRADRRSRNALNQTKIAQECAEWLERKAAIKAVSSPVFQTLFHVKNPDGGDVAIHGSSPDLQEAAPERCWSRQRRFVRGGWCERTIGLTPPYGSCHDGDVVYALSTDQAGVIHQIEHRH